MPQLLGSLQSTADLVLLWEWRSPGLAWTNSGHFLDTSHRNPVEWDKVSNTRWQNLCFHRRIGDLANDELAPYHSQVGQPSARPTGAINSAMFTRNILQYRGQPSPTAFRVNLANFLIVPAFIVFDDPFYYRLYLLDQLQLLLISTRRCRQVRIGRRCDIGYAPSFH